MNKRVDNFLMSSKTPSIVSYTIDGIILKLNNRELNLTEAYKDEDNRDRIEDMLYDIIDSGEIDYKNKKNLENVIKDLRRMKNCKK